MDDELFLDDAADGMPSDAAAPDEAADDLSSLLDALSGSESPADTDAPDEDAERLDASDDEENEEVSDEDELEALKAEIAQYRQQRRDAEAQAAEARSRTYWMQDRQRVDNKLYQGLSWLEQELGKAFDENGQMATLSEHLPRIIEGYARDLTAHKDRQIAAVWQIARQHGSTTWMQQLQQAYDLDADDMREIASFPPEQMESAARLIVRARGPVADELQTTKGTLRKTTTQLRRQRLAQQITPGSGRGAALSPTFQRALEKVDGSPEQLPTLLRGIFGIG